jgi:lysophospholipase L1-like esterase
MSSQLKILAASCLRNAGGDFITSGTFSVVGTDVNGKPIPVSDSAGQQFTVTPAVRQINNGSIIGPVLSIPNPATATPRNYRVQIRIVDQSRGPVYTTTIYSNCPVTDDGAGNWNFASMKTGAGNPNALVISGDQGASAYDLAGGTATWGSVSNWLASLKGVPGDLQAQAVISVQAATQNLVTNLFDSARVTANSFINALNGTVGSASGWYATGFMVVQAGTQIVSSIAISNGGNNGYAFYDINQAFISGAIGVIAAGTPISVPATASFVRMGFSANPSATLMVVQGATVPTSYVGFGTVNPAITPSVTQVASVVASSLPAINNLFDVSRIQKDAGLNISLGTIVTAGLTGFYVSDYMPVIGGQTYNLSTASATGTSQFGIGYFRADKTYIGPGPGLPYTAGLTFTPPANCAFIRMTGAYSAGSFPDAAKQMVTLGATPPSIYIPFLGTPVFASPWRLKKWGVFGDSISADFVQAWQNAVSVYHGMTLTFQDARHGRFPNQIFENYSGSPLTRVTSTTTPASSIIGGTVGNTLAQDIAALDLLLIELGTNTPQNAFGTVNDTPTTDSFCGNMMSALEAIMTAKPSIRLAWITPYRATGSFMANPTQFLQLNGLIKSVAMLYSIPVIDIGSIAGFNSFTWSTFLIDGVHPNPTGFARYSSAIAQALTLVG